MVLTVYSYPVCPSCRAVLMTARHLGIKVEIKNMELSKGELLKPEFVKLSPTHTVPVIDDNGFIMWESRAIQTYLVNKYAPDSSLYPTDPQKRAVVDKMLYFDISTLYRALGEFLLPQILGKQEPDVVKEKAFKKALAVFDEILSKSAYAAGDQLTLADLSISAGLSFIEIIKDYDFSAYPKVSAWMSKLKSELPYYQEINADPFIAAKDQLLKPLK